MPATNFTAFNAGLIVESGSTDTDGMITGNVSGVSFTVSYPTVGGNYSARLGPTLAVTNSLFPGTQSFTLNWDDGMGGTQASSISLDGSFDANEVFFTTDGGGFSEASNNVAFSGQVTGVRFVLGNIGDFVSLNLISLSINCFAPGTRIATPDGPRDVHTLSKGDYVLTADGRAVRVTWLGTQTINARVEHPKKINPIRIKAGALGYGLPVRDLRLSPDHGVEIDGVLYNAGTLVNGKTIYQEGGVLPEGFTYYHIETAAHELLLAEGVPAESFIDYAGRDAFDNGDELGAPIPEMPLPRVSSKRMVPDHIRARLSPKIAAE